MIRRLDYQEIDFDLYDQRMSSCEQNADYVQRSFLDLVTDKSWSILVMGNYDIVMPFLEKSYFGIKAVLMPKFCQQMGVFSEIENPEITEKFYTYFTKNFNIISYSFNQFNILNRELKRKVSYLLPRNQYTEIKTKYSANRRRNVRWSADLENFAHVNTKPNFNELRSFFLEYFKGTDSTFQKEIYFNLTQDLYSSGLLDYVGIYYQNKIHSCGFFYKGKKRNYLSIFIHQYPLKNPNIPSILIDQYVQRNIHLSEFDFMGSSIKNIAQFNERFGALKYYYPVMESSRRQFVVSYLKRVFALSK